MSEKDIGDTVVFMLEENGYEVISSGDAKILKDLDEHKPDLILMDNWLTDWKSDAPGSS